MSLSDMNIEQEADLKTDVVEQHGLLRTLVAIALINSAALILGGINIYANDGNQDIKILLNKEEEDKRFELIMARFERTPTKTEMELGDKLVLAEIAKSKSYNKLTRNSLDRVAAAVIGIARESGESKQLLEQIKEGIRK